jgi:hypothetical protein
VLAAIESGNGQELRRRDDALSASAVNAYLEDAPTLGPGEPPGYGGFPYPGVANYRLAGATGWFERKMSSGS